MFKTFQNCSTTHQYFWETNLPSNPYSTSTLSRTTYSIQYYPKRGKLSRCQQKTTSKHTDARPLQAQACLRIVGLTVWTDAFHLPSKACSEGSSSFSGSSDEHVEPPPEALRGRSTGMTRRMSAFDSWRIKLSKDLNQIRFTS